MNRDEPLTPKLQGDAEENLNFLLCSIISFLHRQRRDQKNKVSIRQGWRADDRWESGMEGWALKTIYASRCQCKVELEISVAQAAIPRVRTIVPALFICAYVLKAQRIWILIINLAWHAEKPT